MIVAMFFGMSESLGALTAPWSYVANAALILQFPLTRLHAAIVALCPLDTLRCCLVAR